MKITQSSLDYSHQYRQMESRQRTRQQEIAQQSTGARQPATAATSTTRTDQLTASTLVRLDSSQHTGVYTRSSVANAAGVVNANFATAQSLNTMLSRFYNQSVRVTSTLERPGGIGAGQQALASRITRAQVSEHFLYQKEQQLGFAARGSVSTDDGRTINFEFYANATQQFRYESGSGALAEQMLQRKDPLVINFAGGFNNLSDTLFEFDLDSDGQREQLAFTGHGSGFLVFDRNADGVINNGGEMFGTRTGDGFAELAEYDEDGNGFIDSGDSLFSQLKIYTRDAQGNDQLLSLNEVNIGALSVTGGQSPFAITDQYNNELGVARATGIFISNDGQVGSLQQIDLTQRNLAKEASDQAAFQAPSDPIPAATNPDDTEAAPSNPRFADILDAVEKLNALTKDLLNRADEDTEQAEPKSLLGQLVDTLEAYRADQAAKQRSAEQSKETEPGSVQDTKRA